MARTLGEGGDEVKNAQCLAKSRRTRHEGVHAERS